MREKQGSKKQSTNIGIADNRLGGAFPRLGQRSHGGQLAMGLTRAIHIVDIENLARTPRPPAAQVRDIRALYRGSEFFREGDLTVIACNHGAASEVAFGWRDARLKIRSGPDGADLALLEAIEEERLPQRYTRVVVASGDGIFADSVSSLARYGIDVSVVAPVGGLSNRLRLAARRHSLIDTTPVIPYSLPSEAA